MIDLSHISPTENYLPIQRMSSHTLKHYRVQFLRDQLLAPGFLMNYIVEFLERTVSFLFADNTWIFL